MPADRAAAWLRLCGCEDIFPVSAATGEGLWRIFEYLRQPEEDLPWEGDAGEIAPVKEKTPTSSQPLPSPEREHSRYFCLRFPHSGDFPPLTGNRR